MLTDPEILELAKDTVRAEVASAVAAAGRLDHRFVEAARRLLACSGKVLVAGSGTSHSVGARLAHLLSCCGTPALFIHPGDAQHGQSGAVSSGDVLIALSKGGSTLEVNHLARIAKSRGAVLIALTEKPESELGRMADVVLEVQAEEGVDPYGMIATGSSLTNAAICDALCVVLLRLRGYSEEAFSRTHPGGAVGHRIASRSQESKA